MASFIQDTLTRVPGIDPRPTQRAQFFSGLNEGPAATASRIAGLVSPAEAKDNSPYYTSNFGQLLPDSGHPLNIGGIPYQGDALLLEKQQAFDRGKLTERIVHPAGWGAFGESIGSGYRLLMESRPIHRDQGCFAPYQGQLPFQCREEDSALHSPEHCHIRSEC